MRVYLLLSIRNGLMKLFIKPSQIVINLDACMLSIYLACRRPFFVRKFKFDRSIEYEYYTENVQER